MVPCILTSSTECPGQTKSPRLIILMICMIVDIKSLVCKVTIHSQEPQNFHMTFIILILLT